MANALAATLLAAMKRLRETVTDGDLLSDAARFREKRFWGGFISVEPKTARADVND